MSFGKLAKIASLSRLAPSAVKKDSTTTFQTKY